MANRRHFNDKYPADRYDRYDQHGHNEVDRRNERSHNYPSNHKEHKDQYTSGSFPHKENIEGHNLYEWGKWRTNINDNIIKDVMTKKNRQNYPSIDRLVKTKDGAYIHDRTGRKVKGDPTYVMNYSLGTNQVTELSPEEFLTYGIPRVNISTIHNNSKHGPQPNHAIPNVGDRRRKPVDKNYVYPDRDVYPNNRNQRNIKSTDEKNHNRYRGDNKYGQRNQSPSPQGRLPPRRNSPEHNDKHRYRSPQPRINSSDPNWRENERNPQNSNGYHHYDYHKDGDRYKTQDIDDKMPENTSDDENSVADYNNTELFTPRTDYTSEPSSVRDIPQSLQKVFAQHSGAHKPIKVFPDGPTVVKAQPPPPPPVIPVPPPPPPLPAERK